MKNVYTYSMSAYASALTYVYQNFNSDYNCFLIMGNFFLRFLKTCLISTSVVHSYYIHHGKLVHVCNIP